VRVRTKAPASAEAIAAAMALDEIEKYERLNHFADVGGADHADDRPVRVAARDDVPGQMSVSVCA
jgi:hypothetical protein